MQVLEMGSLIFLLPDWLLLCSPRGAGAAWFSDLRISRKYRYWRKVKVQ